MKCGCECECEWVYQRIEIQTRDGKKMYRVVDFFMNLIGCHLLLNVKLTHFQSYSCLHNSNGTRTIKRVFNRFEMNEQTTPTNKKESERKRKLTQTVILSFDCKVTNATYVYKTFSVFVDDKAHAFSNAHLFLFHLSNFYLYTRYDTYTPWQIGKWKWKKFILVILQCHFDCNCSALNWIDVPSDVCWTFVKRFDDRSCVCMFLYSRVRIYTISLLSQIRYGVVLLEHHVSYLYKFCANNLVWCWCWCWFCCCWVGALLVNWKEFFRCCCL